MTETKETVRHIVAFKFSSGTTEEQIETITDAFRNLQRQIPGIISFEYGVNNSPEALDRGLTHVYLLTFEDAGARDTYLPHLAHKQFGELLSRMQAVEEVFVVDYIPRE